jgi:tetratricopeptide (TPR) repeat protein
MSLRHQKVSRALVARSRNLLQDSRPFAFLRGFFCMVRFTLTPLSLDIGNARFSLRNQVPLMKKFALLFQWGALCAALLLARPGELRAQPATEATPQKQNLEELSQAELLRAYLQVRDQLHATQLAIANSRAETEATARAQSTAIAEKLEAIKSTMEAERQRQQVETLRANAERERQQMEAQRSNRTVLWVAVGFGAIGLLAMLFMPLVQLRTINRIAEVATQRTPVSASMSLITTDADTMPGSTVSLSNQRLMGVIERMEKRILELENTTVPLPAAAATEVKTTEVKGTNGTDSSAHHNAADDAARVSVLLNKGKFLLSTNKPKEAVACYDEILKIDANNAEALVKKGSALERLKQDDAAIRCYDRAIEVNQKMTLAYLSKAGVCNRLGRYDEAMECYEHALQTEEEGK